MRGSRERNHRSLINRRNESVRPVEFTIQRQAVFSGQYDEGRQILVLRPQRICDPASERRTARAWTTGVDCAHSRGMGTVERLHRTNERDVISNAADVWQQFTHFDAAFAVTTELPFAAEQFAAVARRPYSNRA